KVAQQRLHDQLNALCPGLSAPAGHGRVLELEDSSGQAVLACAGAFAGRAPAPRSLQARAPGRLFASNARYWAGRWIACLPPPPDAAVRAERLGGRARGMPPTQPRVALARHACRLAYRMLASQQPSGGQ